MTYTSAECTVGKLLMMGRRTARNVDFLDKNKFGKISASLGLIKKKFVTMHGHMNVKFKQHFIFSYLVQDSSLRN